MCHTYHNPRNQLPFPFQVKKNKKQNKKTRTTHAHFLGYHMDWKDRNVTYIYSFEPDPLLGCQGDSDDVIGSKVNTPN